MTIPNLVHAHVFVIAALCSVMTVASTKAESNNELDTASNMDVRVPVSVQQVEFSDYAKPVIGSGIIKPLSEQSLAFKVSGIISKVLVKEGQMVKKGTVLARLESEEIDAQVAKAQAVYTNALRQLERINSLKERQLVSDEQIRQATTAKQVAQSDLRIAKFNRKYSVVTAPSAGQILTRLIEPNELIQAGQDAFIFADKEYGWSVRLAVADVDVVKLALGDTAKISLDAYPNRIFKGVINEIAGRANVLSQTFEIDVAIKNAPKLYSGLVAHTKIEPAQKQRLSKVPLTALIQANGQNGQVYVANAKGETQLKNVQIRYLDGANALISQGITEGEWIVVQGGPFILEGNEVRIVNKTDMLNETAVSNTSKPIVQSTQTIK
jgi:RND family efflux transporter MFP subunit